MVSAKILFYMSIVLILLCIQYVKASIRSYVIVKGGIGINNDANVNFIQLLTPVESHFGSVPILVLKTKDWNINTTSSTNGNYYGRIIYIGSTSRTFKIQFSYGREQTIDTVGGNYDVAYIYKNGNIIETEWGGLDQAPHTYTVITTVNDGDYFYSAYRQWTGPTPSTIFLQDYQITAENY